MKSPTIHVQNLRKVYTVSEQEAGTMAALGSLVRRRRVEVAAVDGISFDLSAGEIVGFPGTQRRRQDDHAQDAFRCAASHLGRGDCARLRSLEA